MARSIVALAFVAICCIALTQAAPSAQEIEVESLLTSLSTRNAATCQVAATQALATLQNVVKNVVTLRTIVPNLELSTLRCILTSASAPQNIPACEQGAIQGQIGSIQRAVTGIAQEIAGLGQELTQLVTNCIPISGT